MNRITEYLKVIIKAIFDAHTSFGNYVYQFYVDYSRMILDFMHTMFKSAFTAMLFIAMMIAMIYLGMSVFVYFNSKRKMNKQKYDYTPTITIQIPTYNELAAISCAKRCIDFDYPKDKMQIIIGDDSNKKDISRKIDMFASEIEKLHPGLLIVTRRGKNIGFKPGNLNHMLKYTTGEYIIIFDSDFLPDSDFAKKMVQPFKNNKNLAVVQSRWKATNFDQNIISMLGGSISILYHHVVLPFVKSFKGSALLCGSAEIIRKSDLEEVGGWLSGSLTEDVECTMRLLLKGKNLIYLEEVECECEVPHTLNDLFKQQMRWAFGVVTALKMHLGKLLFNRKIKTRHKASVLIFAASGYMFSIILFLITILGLLSLLTDTPGPIDWARLLSETGINILMTSGFLLATAISLFLSKNVKRIPQIIFASFTIGLVMTYYVNLGIIKALFGRQMQWFMLKKNANEALK